MRFTYCLVTKGRPNYLLEALASLREVLCNPDVQVVIIDNGCPVSTSQMLQSWCLEYGDRAIYIRFDVNQTAAPRVWAALRELSIDWITFPGDDDVVCSDFLSAAREMSDKNKSLTAISASMRIIDSFGKPTGQIRTPMKFEGNRVQFLANSLHQPPFLFPALFIKFDAVAMSLPSSRFIFDWWLSLNLISLGNIVTTDTSAINYRIHDGQESAAAPARRKYFEAQVVLSRFINSIEFENFLGNLSDGEKLSFCSSLQMKSPIYGDLEFGSTLLFNIILKVADSMVDSNLAADLIGQYAAVGGTFLRAGEISSFLAPNQHDVANNSRNFDFRIVEGSCEQFLPLEENFVGDRREMPSFSIGCKHAKASPQYLLDCNLGNISVYEVADSLILKITTDLEVDGVYDYKISNTERVIVTLFRKLKSKVPKFVFNEAFNLFTRSGR
jgi:hypothetical protein